MNITRLTSDVNMQLWYNRLNASKLKSFKSASTSYTHPEIN